MELTNGDRQSQYPAPGGPTRRCRSIRGGRNDKCQHLIDKIASLQNSVNTLNAKIIITLYWYDLQGNYPTPNKNFPQEKYPIKAIFTVTEHHCGGLSSGRNCKVSRHKKNHWQYYAIFFVLSVEIQLRISYPHLQTRIYEWRKFQETHGNEKFLHDSKNLRKNLTYVTREEGDNYLEDL